MDEFSHVRPPLSTLTKLLPVFGWFFGSIVVFLYETYICETTTILLTSSREMCFVWNRKMKRSFLFQYWNVSQYSTDVGKWNMSPSCLFLQIFVIDLGYTYCNISWKNSGEKRVCITIYKSTLIGCTFFFVSKQGGFLLTVAI